MTHDELREAVVELVVDGESSRMEGGRAYAIAYRVLALIDGGGLREELALYKEEYEARHSYGHKQGITSPQAKRYQEAKRKLIVFRALARTPPQKPRGEGAHENIDRLLNRKGDSSRHTRPVEPQKPRIFYVPPTILLNRPIEICPTCGAPAAPRPVEQGDAP